MIDTLATRTALVVGAGGLGCPVSLGLAEAGIGRIVLCDADRVDATNLHRQVLYSPADVGRLKVEAAREALRDRIPGVRVVPRAERVEAANIDAIIDAVRPDVLIDATDDPAARFVLNDAACRHRVPAVVGGVIRFEGLVLAVDPRGDGPCFRCLFEAPPAPDEVPTCASAGVLGAMAGVVGHLQAKRAVRLLTVPPAAPGFLDWAGYVTTVDGLRDRVRDVHFPADPRCPGCHPAEGHPGGRVPTEAPGPQEQTMAVTIKIPTSLRRFAGGVAVVEVASATVRDALDALDAAHPGIKAKLCDSDGNLRRFINIYADEEDIRFLDHLDTALEDGTELQIVPAIAGGAGETSALTADQRRRYARQLTLDEVGRRGQERLLAARVALDGDGPAAQEAATYLAAAGVGRLEVSPSLHARLAARLGALNPDVTLAVGGSDQVADLRLPPFETDDRLTGSRAALAALVALCTGASGEGEASP